MLFVIKNFRLKEYKMINWETDKVLRYSKDIKKYMKNQGPVKECWKQNYLTFKYLKSVFFIFLSNKNLPQQH